MDVGKASGWTAARRVGAVNVVRARVVFTDNPRDTGRAVDKPRCTITSPGGLMFHRLQILASVAVVVPGLLSPGVLTAQTPVSQASAAESASMDTVAIQEWEVPWKDTRPRDPYVAPDGQVWFVGQA